MDLSIIGAMQAIPDHSDTEILKVRYAQLKAQYEDVTFENAFLHERVATLKDEITALRRGNLRLIA